MDRRRGELLYRSTAVQFCIPMIIKQVLEIIEEAAEGLAAE